MIIKFNISTISLYTQTMHTPSMKLFIAYKLDSIHNMEPEARITAVKSFSYDKSNKIVEKIIAACSLKHPSLEKLPAYEVIKLNLNEIVNNCLDSIAEKRLSNPHFDKAEINVLISEKNNHFIIKIKDNGMGLGKSALAKLSYYEFENLKSKEHFQKRGKEYCIGGHGIGLFSLNARLAKKEAQLFLKTRKEAGASIEISMKMTVDSESNKSNATVAETSPSCLTFA